MRTIPLVTITFTALSLSTIGAHAAPWCSDYSGRGGGGSNCGFYSFDQCLANVRGIGGFCVRNPFEIGSAGSAYGYAREPRRRYRHR
jgi:hypothetical protein